MKIHRRAMAPLFALVLAGALLAPGASSAQETQEDLRGLYTSTAIGLLVGIPLTITNNQLGNPGDGTALEVMVSTTSLLELSELTSSLAASDVSAARMYVKESAPGLAQDIAMGGGAHLQELFVILGVSEAALDHVSVRRALRRRRGELYIALTALERHGAYGFLDLLLEVTARGLTRAACVGSAGFARG